MAEPAVTRKQCANAIRALSMDAVQKANSGHPGAPMGMADIAEVLWKDHLNHSPSNPKWFNRDRFVLSNGHGSMLIYSLLHLTGYELSIKDLKQFRQMDSKTPGHPEYGYTPGVETTTGPLGQGLANAVGMAIAEKTLGAQFNRPGFDVVDHHTYVFAGDGCLMEGISHEVCSLAGTLKLGKLIVFYDDNGISIDGEVEDWFSDDTAKRFDAYDWQVLAVDGHDSDAINEAVIAAKADPRPTLIKCKTIIGFGSPNKQGTSATHGAPLGPDEIKATREALDWPHNEFIIPEDIKAAWDCTEKGFGAETAWKELLVGYEEEHPELAMELVRRLKGQLPGFFKAKADEYIASLQANPENIASRKASQNCLEAYGSMLPELIGGSADLTRLKFNQLVRKHAANRQRRWQLHLLRRARIWHDCHRLGHRLAWRFRPLHCDLPDLYGIRTQRGPHGCLDAAAKYIGLHARLHRPGRRRSDSPAHRADREPAQHAKHVGMATLR